MRLLLVVVPLLLLLAVACGDDQPAQPTPTSDVVPAATAPFSASTRDEQRAVVSLLPEPPGASLRNPGALVPSSEEGLGPQGLILSYFVQDKPDAVEQFYRRELPQLGWSLEEPPVLDTTDALSFANQNIVVSFTKGDVRVAVVVSPNEKDPGRGATFLHVVVEEL